MFGDFLVIPINDSFLYVQPVYVRSNQENSIPELKRVVVVNGNAVGLGTSLSEALAASTSGQTDRVEAAGRHRPGGSIDEQVAGPAQPGAAALRRGRRGADAGDLATYQSELDQRRQLVQQANDLVAQQSASGAGGATPTPTASPSP